MNIFIFKALLMSILPFYRVDFPVSFMPKIFIYEEHENGKLSGKKSFYQNYKEYKELTRFIYSEKILGNTILIATYQIITYVQI